VSSVPSKRVRHRSDRDEITVEQIARKLYLRNPDTITDSVTVHWTAAKSFGSERWSLAIRQAQDIYTMFQPYDLMHTDRSTEMFEKCLRNGITEHSLEDIDRAIQSEVESLSDDYGFHYSPDHAPRWSEIQDRVLQRLDINEGHYWAAEIG